MSLSEIELQVLESVNETVEAEAWFWLDLGEIEIDTDINAMFLRTGRCEDPREAFRLIFDNVCIGWGVETGNIVFEDFPPFGEDYSDKTVVTAQRMAEIIGSNS